MLLSTLVSIHTGKNVIVKYEKIPLVSSVSHMLAYSFSKYLLALYCVLEKVTAPHPVLLPGKSHGQRSLVGCSPWDPEELDMTERLHFHCSLSCTGEGNGHPLQCSCLENPREAGGLPSMGSHRVGQD